MHRWFSQSRSVQRIAASRVPRTVVALMMLSAPLRAHGQIAPTVQTIDASKPSCKSCSLALTKIASIGNKDDPEFAGTAQISTTLTVDSKGRFLATELGGNRILVYAPGGKFSEAFGVTGDGPGEFRRAMKVTIDAGDSIHVLSQLRMTMYSPQFKFIRGAALPVEAVWPTAPLVMKGGQVVFAGFPLKRGGFQYHQMSPKGELTGFGAWTDSLRACSLCARQTLAASLNANRFWSMHANSYDIYEKGTDERPTRHFSIVNSSWFKPWGAAAGYGGPTIKPQTTFMELFQDRAGLLWVEGHGAIANWTPVPNLNPPSANRERGAVNIPIGGGKVPGPEVLKRHITYIDVFDPATGRLVLAQAFIGRQLRMISAQHLAELREDADGIPVWDVFKVEIRRQ